MRAADAIRGTLWDSAPSLEVYTHRLLSSSFLGVPYRILNIIHKKELLRT